MMGECRRVGVLLLLLIPLGPFPATAPSSAMAQVIRGRLVDFNSGEAIPAATLTLLEGHARGQVLKRTMADSAGLFRFRPDVEGRFRLKAERIGYQTVTSPPFDVTPSDTLEVELTMSVEAVPLAPLTVVSTRGPLVLSRIYEVHGFLERRQRYGREGLGLGDFLTREDWDHRSPGIVADIVREVSGVRVVGSEIRMRITGFDPRGCIPEYYLDGIHVRMLTERSMGVTFKDTIDELVSPSEIVAIEIYTGISKPPQFMDMGGKACGAVAIWTG